MKHALRVLTNPSSFEYSNLVVDICREIRGRV